MNSLRRWLYRPKRSDPSLLAQFYFADEELNLIAAELDGFEGRKDPERCAALVNQLRACQARVLNIVSQMMDESIKDQRALRDFRVKFPDDVIQENLAGQLWFGAECLAAGSSIMNREVESACMRPLARALTKNLDSLRTILREQCLHNVDEYTELIKENLIIFDKLFAEFELSYVSAMVSVKTAHEYDMIQEITVLFSETVQRALKIGLLTQEMIDEYDPALMFTIPRLAIICGVLIFKDGPLNPDNDPWNISEMFRPFQTLLLKIRELLGILTIDELGTLERALCSQDEPSFLLSLEEKRKQAREERRKLKKERKGSGKLKNDRKASDGDNGSIESELTAREIAERLEALALNFEASHNNSENIDKSDPAVNGDDSKSEELPSSSIQNGDGNNESSTNVNGLVVDLGRVEDLYREVNLDSSDMITPPSSAYPGNDLLIQGIQMPEQFLNNNESGQIHEDSHSSSSLSNLNMDNDQHFLSPNENCENHDEVLNDREKFSLNKCDSRDSGLQSEVVSNSGSMFTISSSDSNQQILSSDSMATPSDQNCTDSSEEVDCHDSSTNKNGDCNTHLENSSDSSATIVGAMAIDDGKDLRSDNAIESVISKSNSPVNSDIGLEDAMRSLANGTSEMVELTQNPEIQNVSDILETVSENVASISTLQSDSMSILDKDCASINTENRSHSNPSKTMPNTSTESATGGSSNHSHDASCDKSKPQNDSANLSEMEVVKGDDTCGTVTENHSEDKLTNHSTFENDDNSVIQNFDILNSTKCEKVGENTEETVDSDSGSCAVSVNEQLPGLSQQDLPSSFPSSSSSHVDVNVTTVNPNLPSGTASAAVENGVKEKADCSSSTQCNEIPHSSETVQNGSSVVPVNSVKRDHHKGASTMKSKTNSKKRNKNPDRRARRQESGTYRSRDSKPMLCPHHAKMIMEAHQTLDADHYNSSDTSSYTSECGDQEEIALAIEAAESASRNHVRARFRSSSDMIHRLFVCISGVADQLQTNFAGDLRNILRCVFDMNCPEPMDPCENEKPKDNTPLGAAYRAMSHASRTQRHRHSSLRRDPPAWLPDDQSNECMACQVPFNFLRRRHHCRNCGKIFCSRCSSNFVPLPHFGQEKAVRVCNRCFMFQVTPFTTE